MLLQKRIASAIATGALLLNLATPAYAGTITLTGNGDSSTNDATVNVERSNTVVQNNNADVTNNVTVNSSTGGNSASRNTGGDVVVDTGDASANVSVENNLNANHASLDCCGAGDVDVLIYKNGVDSTNNVDLDLKNNNSIYQDNEAKVKNDIDVDAKTGYNDANRNTGGNVEVLTGDADVDVDVTTNANVNHATIGGSGDENGGLLSLWIAENGDSSDNDIDADIDSSSTIRQDNNARVYNDVDVDAVTGKNDANRNTGGDVLIDTGDATVDVTVDNMVNFNHAALDCGCLFDDWDLLIKKNGVDSDNNINLDLSDGEKDGVFQDNYAKLDNDLQDLDAKTGYNDADRNTGGYGSDPSIYTGDADVTADVNNTANTNTAGGDAEFEFPGADVDFSFDLGDLLDWLAAHHS